MNSIFSALSRFQEKAEPIAAQVRFFTLALFIIFLPFDMIYSTVMLFVAGGISLFGVNRKRISLIPRQFWIFQLVFLLSVAGYFYSTDLFRAGYLIERQLAILIFPILLPLAIDISPRKVQQLLLILTLTCLGCILFLLYTALHTIWLSHLPFRALFSTEFLNHKFSAPIGIHAGYFSLYVSLSVIYVIKTLAGTAKLPVRLVYLLLVLPVLVCGLFLLASRNILISTGIIMLIIYPVFFIKRKVLYFSGCLVVLAVTIYVFSKSVYFNERFSSELMYDIKSGHKVNPDPNPNINPDQSEPRIERWKCAIPLVKARPLFGYGTGDEVMLLKEQYRIHQFMAAYKLDFNAHNQYLSYLIKGGFTGLLIFLGMLAYFFRLALLNRDFIYLSFLFMLLVGLFTENILDSNKGIFYFAFFNTLLGYNILAARKQNRKKV